MRSKTPLALMEQTVMLLVFALAAALCLRAFAFADQTSRRNEAVDHAVLLAQNTAETLKAAGAAEGETLWYTEELTAASDETEAAYRVEIRPEESGVAGLGRAVVSVYDAGGEALFSLSAAWQEVTVHG